MATTSSHTHHDHPSGKSQGKPLEDLPHNEFDDLVNTVKAARETRSIRDRFPEGLAEAAARIHVVSPAETTSVERHGGANFAECASFEHKLHLSIERAIKPIEGQLPTRQLDITARQWGTHTRYLTGSSVSTTWTLTVQYDGKSRTAEMSQYGDPGMSVVWAEHGDMKGFLDVILQDLGVESGVLKGLQLLTLLLGDAAAKKVLDDPIYPTNAEKFPSLRVTIDEERSIEEYD